MNAALLNLTKVLADRGVRDGVRVNAVDPSSIAIDRLNARVKIFDVAGGRPRRAPSLGAILDVDRRTDRCFETHTVALRSRKPSSRVRRSCRRSFTSWAVSSVARFARCSASKISSSIFP